MGRPGCRIGTSGYQYDHWRGVFYPEGLPKREWFGHYAGTFDAVEINNTFYQLPSEETFRSWRAAAPRSFLFILKFSRYGTHMKKLKDPAGSIGAFLDRARLLGDHLGPVLVQLPPNWRADPERLDAFLSEAPNEHRWAVELRDPSWLVDEVYDVLRHHNAALVVHDMMEDHPRTVTADWVYLRFHGPGEADYEGSYSPQALSGAARRMRGHMERGRDAFAFFNNDQHGHAVRNARDLKRYLRRD